MLALKLVRRGKKGQPSFRLVAVDKEKNPRGKSLEDLGRYEPTTKKIILKKERILFWLSQGAQPTSTFHNLLVKNKILQKPKIKIKIGKKKGGEVKEP